jgi:glycosyltransferase involved in cell wall biosynthesis
MLNVALFSHTRHLCGAERMLLNLAILLQRSGNVRPVLLVPGDGDLVAEARRHGIRYDIVPAAPWYLYPPRSMSDYRRGVDECCAALRTALVDLNCDAVLVNTLTSVPAMLAAVELDLPSLVWVHGVLDSLLLPGRSSAFAAAHDELLLHSATRVIALPCFTSDFCAQVVQRRQLDVLPNWTLVDPHFTADPQKYRSRRCVCLNTFDVHKGHGTLLKAAVLLKARKTSFQLDLYGDGPLEEEVKQRAARLGLQDCVCFRGRSNRVQEVYDGALCVINPADVEPFPMTLIEPMVRKTPVLATRSGGPGAIVVDGQCGYLVERGDEAAMADRMQALLESPELAQRLGEEGYRRASAHFSEDAARAALLPLIEATIRDFRGYEPAVTTLAKIYRLGFGQAAARSSRAAKASRWTRDSMHKAARLAKGGLCRTRALGRRVLALLGLEAERKAHD